jgi:hypothetical protein
VSSLQTDLVANCDTYCLLSDIRQHCLDGGDLPGTVQGSTPQTVGIVSIASLPSMLIDGNILRSFTSRAMMSSTKTKEQCGENSTCLKRKHLNTTHCAPSPSLHLPRQPCDEHGVEDSSLLQVVLFGFLRPFWFWSPFGLTQSSILRCPVRQHSSVRPDHIRMWTSNTGIGNINISQFWIAPDHSDIYVIQKVKGERRCANGEEYEVWSG